MAKVYFCKYLPTSGEIREGDFYFQTYQAGQIGRANKEDYLNATYKELQKVKPFLCSREIGVGDKLTGWSNRTTHIAVEEDIELFKECGIHSHVFKVIGEISPHAMWVREGDEFTEEEVKIWKTPRKIAGGLLTGKPRTITEGSVSYIEIKCSQCQQFH